jgi:uncharacterized protein
MNKSLKKTRGGFDRSMIIFWILAYVIVWVVLGIFKFMGDQVSVGGLDLLGMAENHDYGSIIPPLPTWLMYSLSRIADFSFSIAGLITIYYFMGKAGLVELWERLTKWKIHWGWYLFAILPLVLYFIAAFLANGSDPSIFGTAVFNGSIVKTLLFSLQSGLLVSLFLRGAMGEELGLRGFALPHLQKKLTPFRASIVIGALWAAWHIPVLIGRDIVSMVAFIILAFALSFVFTLMYNGSGGSLIPGLIFHATQNWEEGFETIFPNLVNHDWELVSTLLTLVVGIVCGVIVWRRGKK